MKTRTRLALAGNVALALAGGLLAALPAQAQFQERTLRLSVPVPKEHPQGYGVAKMMACTRE